MADFTDKTFRETYRDFYDPKDGYYRVLYNSGRALQARELNESQTIIHEEIARFGRNIFTEGALVSPGGSTVDNRIEYIRLDANSVIDPSLVGETLTNGTIQFIVLEVYSAVPDQDPATLYVRYTDTSNVTDTEKAPRVESGDILTRPDNSTLTVIDDSEDEIPAAGRGTKAYFAPGEFFVQGHFVYMEGGESFLSKYSTEPTADIGFVIEESIVDESEDTNLYDNQGEVPDITAPGAHRYQIKLTPTTRDQVDISQNFIFVARVVNGVITREVSTFDAYSRVNDLLARRTKEESGDYVVDKFTAIFEPLDNTNLNLDVSEGIAYVDGYRLEFGQTDITVPKARQTLQTFNEPVPVAYGNYVYIDPTSSEGFGRLDVFGYLAIYDAASGGNVIGFCNVRGIQSDSFGYRLYIFDIRMSSIQGGTGYHSFADAVSLQDNIPGAGSPRIQLIDSTIHESSNNSLLFPLPRTSPKDDSITANYTVQRYTRIQSDSQGVISLSGVETNRWIIAESETSILTGPESVPSMAGVYSGLTPNTNHDIAYYVEVSNATPRTKTITVVEKTQSLPSIDWEKRPVFTDTVDGISLQSVLFRTSSSTDWADAEDITHQFYLDGGQRDNFYDEVVVYVKPGYLLPTGAQNQIKVTYTHYTHTGPSGSTFFSASSYADDSYENIPNHTSATGQSISLRDVLDFRPSRTFGYTGEFNVVAELPQNASAITINDIEYYLPRIDVLVANAVNSSIGFGELQVIQGVPSITPKEPEIPVGSLSLYTFTLSPYTFSASDVSTTYIPNKRYTMKDIAKLERRLDELYERTALSFLETNTQSLVITDNQGQSRVKSGFFADNFSTFDYSDINNENYRASVDRSGLLQASFRENSVRLSYSADNVDTVISKKGDLVTLPYVEVEFTEQELATSFINVNPHTVVSYIGNLELSPSSDEWRESRDLPPVIQSIYHTQEDLWYGGSYNWIDGSVTSFNSNLHMPLAEYQYKYENMVHAQDLLGETIGGQQIIPYMRSRRINFVAKGLRPNTKMFAYFDGVDVSAWVRQESTTQRFADNPQEFGSEYANESGYPADLGGPTLLQTDNKGELIGSFFLPNTESLKFRTGTQKFELLDVSLYDAESTISTSAFYSSQGALDTAQGNIDTTRRIYRSEGRNDPLAQTFFVDQIENPNGIFLTQLDVFMESKDSTAPLQVEIRTVENGVPTNQVVPGSVVFVNSDDVTVTSYDSISGENEGMNTLVTTGATAVEFDEPIYLTGGKEYAIILFSESVEYNVYISESEEFVIGSNQDKAPRISTLGSLFLSQNSSTWTPDQSKDLMFKLHRANFETSGNLVLDNAPLPKVTLEFNPIETVAGLTHTDDIANNGIVKIYHQGHGFSDEDIVSISGVVNDIGGVPASEMNGLLEVYEPTWDGYYVKVPTVASASSSGGGNAVIASQQVYYDTFVPQIQAVVPNTTKINAGLIAPVAKSYGSSSDSRTTDQFVYTLQDEVPVFVNEYNLNSLPKIVASSENVSTETLKLNLSLVTADPKVSPVIDLQRVAVMTLENVIDHDVYDPNTDTPDYTTFAYAAQHITTPVVVDESSLGLKVIFSGNRPSGSDFEVYVKTAPDEDTLVASTAVEGESIHEWVKVDIDRAIPTSDNPSNFPEYEYTHESEQFTAFQIKIVMHSENSSKSPLIKDLRAIALITGGSGSTGTTTTSSSSNNSGSTDTTSSTDTAGETNTGGDDTGTDTGTSLSAVAFPEISQLPTSVSITGAPRILSQYNPESDINNYMTPNEYWHQGTRRVRLFAKFDNNGDFQLYTNDPKKGSVNVGDDSLTGSTILATGKWLDRPVEVGEIFECGFRITHVDDVALPVYSGAFATQATPRAELRNVGTGADIGYQEVISVDVGELDSSGNMITWGGHGLVIDEHSNSLDNGASWTVDSLHLDPEVAITGTVRIEIFISPDNSLDNGTTLTGTTSIPLDVSYTLEGAPLVDDSLESQLVLLNADDGFVNDPDPTLTHYSLDSTKPKNFHYGATVSDQVLTVDANSSVDFHMMWGSEQNSTIDVTFGAAWTNSGTTVTLNRGDFASFTVANAPQGTDATVTATTTLLGSTFTREVKMIVGEGATSTPGAGGSGSSNGDGGDGEGDPQQN